MNYELFTYPNCPHCDEIRTFFKTKEIKYNDTNIGLTSGKKNSYWKHIYSRHLNNTQKLESKPNGDLVFPILGVFASDDVESLEKIVQGDEIKGLF